MSEEEQEIKVKITKERDEPEDEDWKARAEDAEAKLELIAQKEFEKKRTVVLEQAKKKMPEDKVKELEKSLTMPDELKVAEKMLESMSEKKQTGTPAGVAPLSPAQTGQPLEGDLMTKQFDSPQSLIWELKERMAQGDKQAAEVYRQLMAKVLSKPQGGTASGAGLEELRTRRKRR
ncbi:hypothetical protein HXY33_05505 [Candidatus Bathyarchaeota archaeon]|nr:hypothetical protein [Candidatus Bathyarchaeota archaeon]